MPKRDLTKDYDYARLIEEEKTHYSEIEVTDDLKEGGVHAGHCWQYYWQQVAQALAAGPIGYIGDYLDQHFEKTDASINILSLGSGYCGNEIDLARRLKGKAHIVCTDINEQLFSEAKVIAQTEGLNIEFKQEDLNFISIDPQHYQMIFAHAVLHHVINLEHLFEKIAQGLADDGILHLVEVVGQNRRLIWPENEAFANALLDVIPNPITQGIRLHITADEAGMEGIRQEDIIPELLNRFYPIYEYAHGAFMRFICTQGDLAPRFDPDDAEAKRYLDFLIDCDKAAVKYNILKPLEIWGVYKPKLPIDCADAPTTEITATRNKSMINRFKQIAGITPAIDSNAKLSGDCLVKATKQKIKIPLEQLFKGLPLTPLPELLKSGENLLDYQQAPVKRFLQFANIHHRSLLEIGADDAILLSQFVLKGMRRGFGVNNWYWDHKTIKTVKVSEQIILSYGDIRDLPLEDGDFDLIFSVAAFEHIHELDVALKEMYRLLKPGGLVYSHFGPLWSSGIGHHLFFERKGQWHRFTEEESTLPILGNYEHLLFDREQMTLKLQTRWEPKDVDCFIYELYDNPHINRYMYADYLRMFDASPFQVIHLQNVGKTHLDPEVHEQLRMKFGPDNDFSCATLEVMLKKP